MEGIKFILGISGEKGPQGGTTQIQSVLLDKDMYTESEAKTWLRKHAFMYGKMDEGKSYWRARQVQPEKFERFATYDANPISKEFEHPYDRFEKYINKIGRAYDKREAQRWYYKAMKDPILTRGYILRIKEFFKNNWK